MRRRRKEYDDSDYLDMIEKAKADWFAARGHAKYESDETSDEAINLALGLPATGSVRGLALDLAGRTKTDIRAQVKRGLSN